MNTCSVIMVSYRTGPVLFVSVKSALKQKQLAEVIVVDNGNPPDVLARLQQMALTDPRLKIVSGGGNGGFARGCNIGARQAGGDYLLLLNPDCLLPPDALTGMMEALETFTDARLATCRLQNPEGEEQRSDRRRLITPGMAILRAFGLHWLKQRPAHPPSADETREVSAISNTFMCIRRKDFNRLGGMDEGFFLPVADLDLCLRVHRNGGRIIRVPGVRVTHMPGIGGKVPVRFLEWHRAKGLLRYFTKHFQREYVPGLLLVAHMVILVRFAFRMSIGKLRRLTSRQPDPHSVAAKRLMVLASGLAELPETGEFHGRTVLVTGATSQVGLCVVRRLISSGAAVLALSRGDAIPFDHERLRWIKGDLTDEALHLEDYLVDLAVHCAPLWHLPPTLKMLAAAEVKRVIAFGSTSIFGKAMSRNTHEKEVVEQLTRAEADLAAGCDALGIQWTLLRPTLVYGVGLDVNVTSLAHIIDRYGFFPVYPPAFGRRQPVHADDLAMAVLQAAATAESVGKAYNVSGGEVLTYRQMLERLFAVCGRPPRIVATTLLPFLLDMAGWVSRKKHINGEIARRMNDDLIFFHDDARRDFGFHPRPFLSGGAKDIEGF